MTLCGVPEVHMKGTSEDWHNLRKLIQEFTQLKIAHASQPRLEGIASNSGKQKHQQHQQAIINQQQQVQQQQHLIHWLQCVDELLLQFTTSYDVFNNGNNNSTSMASDQGEASATMAIQQLKQMQLKTQFWQHMYKYKSASNGPFISGWITDLFPYLLHVPGINKFANLERNEYLQYWKRRHVSVNNGSSSSSQQLVMDEVEWTPFLAYMFPAPVGSVPIKVEWQQHQQQQQAVTIVDLYCGMIGIKQDKNSTMAVKPHVSYAFAMKK